MNPSSETRAAGAAGPRVFRAAWVCPIATPPIANGWVAVEAGRIVAVGDRSTQPRADAVDLGDVALMPGLVNAHVHFELSPLRGLVPPAPAFTEWVRQLFALRRPGDRPDTPDAQAAIVRAIAEAHASGTALVGDISNSLAAVEALARSPIGGRVFHELLGFRVTDDGPVRASREARAAVDPGGDVTLGVASHAPYSVSPELLRAIRAEADRLVPPISSVHLGESPEEVELLGAGTGPWRTLLEQIGAWRDDWEPPGCDPAEYLDRLGVLAPRTLVVHGVQFDDAALARVAARGAVLVTCPRSNVWVGVGVPPVSRFYRSGVPVAVGTDSLASVADLNLFSELAALRSAAPDVPPRRLLESATLVGARALGFAATHGSIEPGKRAALIAVALPGAVDDVEAFLVGGIAPSQVRWIAS